MMERIIQTPQNRNEICVSVPRRKQFIMTPPAGIHGRYGVAKPEVGVYLYMILHREIGGVI